MSYSNSGGGTLTMPSPTHVHHVDVTSAVRSLRRSISRSPSKYRLVTKSPSPSPKSPLSPSPLSPSKRASSYPALFAGTNTPHTPSPLAVPFPPSSRLAVRSSSRAKTAPPRQGTRLRTSPRSPMKRALSQTIDTGNATPTPLGFMGGQENFGGSSPVDGKGLEKLPRMQLNLDSIAPANQKLSRLGGDGASDCNTSSSSPLKRSDTIMNFDQASLGSPVAKRRSLHGSANFGQDFNAFDPPQTAASPSQFDIHSDLNHEYELSATVLTSENTASPFTSTPRRSSSLRKSTLLQRNGEKTSWGRRHAAQILAAQQSAQQQPFAIANQEIVSPSKQKNRPRLSLDQFVAPPNRDSPFSPQGNLPNASMHAVNQSQQPTHQPHPLSRTMTNSSSSSSIAEDSPVQQVPVKFAGNQKSKIDFSKSLPAGALRPFNLDAPNDFSTPKNFKAVKPLPAAFMSTGLISKVNRRPEEVQMLRGNTKSNVPDTPCKKQNNIFGTYPAAVPTSAIAKARQIRHSFGTPSTPFNPHGAPAIGTFGKGSGVFGSSFGQPRGLTRRGSFLSIDGDDIGSPDFKTDSQISDFDLPPTPTKQAPSFSHFQNGSPTSHRSIPASMSAVGGYSLGKIPRSSTSPLERVDFIERLSPCTPQDSMLPPDPSGLSISNHKDGQAQLGANSAPVAPPPATPTTGRDFFGKTSTTPIGSFPPRDVDESLVSRFDQVEMIGTGEFSQVYRVTQSSQKASAFLFGDTVDSPMSGRTPPTPQPPRIYAVKKSKQPYQGYKDRSRKLKEVEVIKALGQADNVVHYVDSWEEKNYLYIQTEFCEEGSLDIFLYQVGRKGRVDDFRIWKILLEIGQGLKHIHDSGFIHLDIKPANIMITFEGVLKIGDFGMATSWPASDAIEGEGDREYIGPEILLGQYDKPADVFALGMVIFEIATNVYLPDNGVSWQRLRSGDMSEAPSLTWSEASSMLRDANGIPIVPSDDSLTSDDEFDADFGSPIAASRKRFTSSSKSFAHDASNLFGSSRRGELDQAPEFMRDPSHECTLDKLVRWMISPRPQDRPLIHEVLEAEGLQWVSNRRRAGATVFEGNWGPADEVLDDAEMMDV
ncbi:aa12791c-1f3b-483d-93c9-c45280621ef6 [Sclerotinia trifoliorum]|uniref:Aa12791c-1f3b-483d-93c9-c45280621ef6 n=1 Tax=Sclerotinia trifoliorum TaxID=28548 RepID=A0A8H2VUY5_9HELO|nr:aa12791c-1f3b-483d-93c9-c45280621ef6 [Sclerotinia trifoliorum]